MTSKCYVHHHYIQHGKAKVEKNERQNSVHKTTQRSITYPTPRLRVGYIPSTLNTIRIFINTYTLETLFKNPQSGYSKKPTDKPTCWFTKENPQSGCSNKPTDKPT